MSQDDWKFTAPTDLPETVKAIILKPMLVDGIYGLGCSPDNGVTNRVYWTIYGRKYYQEDADRLWPLLIDKVKSVMSVSWDQIQGKPTLVTKGELDQRLSSLDIPSVDGLAKQTELDNVKATAESAISKAEQAQSTADANTKALQNVYTKEEADQKYWTAEQEQNASNVKSVNNIEPDNQGNVNIDLTGYAKIDDIPKSMSWDKVTGKPDLVTNDQLAYNMQHALATIDQAKTKIDTSNIHAIKKPSGYADGIFYEVKSISALSINRSRFDSSAQTGSYGLVTTKVVTVNGTKFAHQKCEVLDSQRLIIFLRHGYSDNWTTWELNQTWS